MTPTSTLPWWQSDLTQQFDGLIFDCDGTLTDSMPLHYIAWRNTLAARGIQFPEDRFYGMGGMPTEKIIQILSGEQGVEVDVESTSIAKEKAFEDVLDQLQPIQVVCDVAAAHRGKLKMAVASGGIRPIIDRQLTQMGITEWFDAVVTSEDTELHKPEPDAFLLAAKLLGVAPTKCLVFEDSPLGFAAAEAAGMQFVDVRPHV